MALKTIIVYSIDKIDKGAEEFINFISNSDLQSNIFAFYGNMGAGKTTFITALCRVLGVEDSVNSPTFTIVNEYRAKRGFPIYHFDFYRINKISEAYEIGIDEYFGGEGLCFIEWPQKIASILPDEVIDVSINVLPDGSRQIEIN